MANPPGKCIFCGGGGLSKEHVFAAWIGALFKSEDDRTVHRVSGGFRDEQRQVRLVPETKGRLENNGSTLSKKLYVVCKTCNNGWMSRLQQAAKPILTPIILGEWRALTEAEQTIVARWVTMTVMVMEHASVASVAIPATERHRFLRTQDAGRSWRTWLAPYVGASPHGLWRTALSLFPKPRPANIALGHNLQITTFTVGRLLVHTISNHSWVPFEIGEDYSAGLGIHRIWPTNPNMPDAASALDDESGSRVVNDLRTALVNL